MPHMQPQPCDNGCCEGKCELPEVTCDLRSEGAYSVLVLFEYTIKNATSAFLEVTCPGEDPVVTDLTELLVDGEYSGVLNSADPECFYRVCATNPCGTFCCEDQCPDITLDVPQSPEEINSDCGNPSDPFPCPGCYSFLWSWSYSIVPALQDTMQFGYIRFYRDGQEILTNYLEPGGYGDLGVVEQTCNPLVDVIEIYVRTSCGRFRREWIVLQDCTWLADRVEVEIAGVADIDDECNFVADPVPSSGISETSRRLTTTGFADLNGTHSLGVLCGLMAGEEVPIGGVEINYQRSVTQRTSFGGPPLITRETHTSVFEGQAILRSTECEVAGLRGPNVSILTNQGVQLELHGTVTYTYLLEDISSGSPVIISQFETVTACNQYPVPWNNTTCPMLHFGNQRLPVCSIDEVQNSLPSLSYTIGDWSDTTTIQVWQREYGVGLGAGDPSGIACPQKQQYTLPGTARIRYVRD